MATTVGEKEIYANDLDGSFKEVKDPLLGGAVMKKRAANAKDQGENDPSAEDRLVDRVAQKVIAALTGVIKQNIMRGGNRWRMDVDDTVRHCTGNGSALGALRVDKTKILGESGHDGVGRGSGGGIDGFFEYGRTRSGPRCSGISGG